MATPTPKRDSPPARYPPRPPAGPPEVVDPRWLLKALALALASAIVLAYLSVCLLVYQGGWQLMLRPSKTLNLTPASASIPFEPLSFDATATGTPRLSAWWIPSPSAQPQTPTLLFLHDGQGSLSSTVRQLALLHSAGVNLFAFDYRGFGQSDSTHPTEAHMSEDTAAAFDYLVNTRHVPASTIIPCGQGLGAVLAVNLATAHPEIPAIILDTPQPDAFRKATTGSTTRLLPMRLLVRDHFDLAAALSGSAKPKLLFADGPFGFITADTDRNQAFFRTLPDPKMTVTFAHINQQAAYLDSLKRFLDEYLPSPPSTLTVSVPSPK